ncbi:MAG: TIGR03987 family protein [Bacteroidetes bacterium]|nr:TIGR03987 family protein [Bacteroidota bacterium]
MNTTLFYAILFINLACLAYTIGVWAEKIQGKLKNWHAAVFWLGLTFDTIGTTEMSMLSGSLIKFNFHGMTGLAAILLMLFHAIWATVVLARKNDKLILNFHRFSIVVWLIWLIPMVSGMVFGASR